jgi:hypothetical protein
MCKAVTPGQDKRDFTKHMLRLRRHDQINGKEVPEIILLNSHDGSSSYKMIPGMFRQVCSNGLVAWKDFGEIRVPHKGDIVGQVIEGAYTVLKTFDAVDENIDLMKSIQLTLPEQRLFGATALNLNTMENQRRLHRSKLLTLAVCSTEARIYGPRLTWCRKM